MRDQLFVLGIIVMLVCVGVFACYVTINIFPIQESDKDKLLGTWTATINDVTMKQIFFSDGTASFTYNGVSDSGTYEFKDGNLIVTSRSAGRETYDYSFSRDGKELTLQKIGSVIFVIYTKQ